MLQKERLKKMKLYLKIFIFSIVLLPFVANTALAQSITLTTTSDFNCEIKGEYFQISGTYSIQNYGDTEANHTYPTLNLGTWTYHGDKRKIAPEKKETWKINETVPIKKITQAESLIKDFFLPSTGKILLEAINSYEDSNGYKFSAITLVTVVFAKPFRPEDKAFELSLAITNTNKTNNTVKTQITVKNTSSRKIKTLLSLHHPNEIVSDKKDYLLDLAPGEQKEIAPNLRNNRGLQGSSYAIFATLRWEGNGQQQLQMTNGIFSIGKKEKISKVIEPDSFPISKIIVVSLILFLFLIFGLFLYLYWPQLL